MRLGISQLFELQSMLDVQQKPAPLFEQVPPQNPDLHSSLSIHAAPKDLGEPSRQLMPGYAQQPPATHEVSHPSFPLLLQSETLVDEHAVTRHVPAEQMALKTPGLVRQLFPHVPQFDVIVFDVHTPLQQVVPAPQTFPHIPQF